MSFLYGSKHIKAYFVGIADKKFSRSKVMAFFVLIAADLGN